MRRVGLGRKELDETCGIRKEGVRIKMEGRKMILSVVCLSSFLVVLKTIMH